MDFHRPTLLIMKETVKNVLRTVHLSGFVKYCIFQLKLLRRIAFRIDERIIKKYLSSKRVRKLQIGCGRNILPGWLNSDLDPLARDVMHLDSTKFFPFEDCIFDYVFSEHNIEHIAYPEGMRMLSECYRILNHGGKIRIATPDLLFLINLHRSNKSKLQNEYIKWLIDAYIPEATSHDDVFIINKFLGGFGHKFIYDEKLLRYALKKVGFINVTKCNLLESEDEELSGLENKTRYPDKFLALDTMVFEGTKPIDGVTDTRTDQYAVS